MRLITILLTFCGIQAAVAQDWRHPTLDGPPPIIIAHRGASGYLPEHTLAAYALAIDLGADFIEPDLVMTKDGHLVARHDDYLSTTTDVAEREAFADRRRTQDGRTDWFVEDFTLAEIKQLRARQPFPGRDTGFDGRYTVPTFEEILDLVQAKQAKTGRRIGIYPETKKPSRFAAVGLHMAPALARALQERGMAGREDPVFVQSFEPEILQRLDSLIDTRLILLVYAEADGTPHLAFEAFADVIDGVGPAKSLLVTPTYEDSGFVARAHALGLPVHAWTHRADRVPPGIADSRDELRVLFGLGIDGIFTDFPDMARTVRAVERLR